MDNGTRSVTDLISLKLLNPGPPEPDGVRGDHDLFKLHGLSKIAEVVLSGNFKVENYQAPIPHFDGLRKGPNAELTSLVDLYPSSAPPDFATVAPSSITLEAGKVALSEAELGGLLDGNALLGNQPEPSPAEEPKKPTKKIKLGFKKKT